MILAALALLAWLATSSAARANPHGAYPGIKCELCHVPHKALSTSFIMTAPDEKRLCYTCHDGTQSVYDARSEFGESVLGTSTKTSSHPVAQGTIRCDDCHTPHAGPAEGNPMSLAAGASSAATGTAVCGGCHGPATTLPEGDKVSRFAGTAHETSIAAPASGSGVKCVACHEPHASSNVSLIAEFVRTIGGATVTVAATSTAAGSRELCLGCHDVLSANYLGAGPYRTSAHGTVTTSTKAAVTYPGAGAPARDCENCHDPHGTGKAKMVRDSGDNLCYTCHDAAGTTKPANYSYQGKTRYQAGAHASIQASTTLGAVTLTSVSPGFAAWESTSSPTPASPGTPLSAAKISRLGSVDGTRAVTSLADATGQHDFQTYRFKLPEGTSLTAANLTWAGYGEEYAGYETSVSVWSRSRNDWVRVANGSFGNQTTVATSFPLTDYADGSGNVWVMADARKILQSAIVAGPTIISAVQTQAVVTWTTAGYADSWVDFGPTSAYGSTVGTSTRVITHTATVALSGSGVYHLRVRSTARDGDSAQSADLAFRNAVPTLVPVSDQVAAAQTFNVGLHWSMADASGAPYTYTLHVWSPYTGYDQTFNGLTSGDTTLPLPANYASTSYYYWQVLAVDKAGYTCSWSPVDDFWLRDSTFVPGGSCPFLFVWDGSGHSFAADLNTTGKLAEKTSSGYSAPGPTDRYVLPTAPAEKDGAYELRLVEERHEVDYTDEFKLYAVDLPDGVDLVAEKGERAKSGPLPPGGLHTLSNARVPSAVRTDTGADVTSLIAASDDHDVVMNDDRENFDYKTLELDLGDVSGSSQVKIVMDANTARPVTDAGVARQRTFGATTKLDVQTTSGTWRSVPTSEATLPNAMEFPRTYVFDIGKAMHDTTGKVRFTFLFKTYIDRIAVDTSADMPLTLTPLPMRDATLGHHGIDPNDRPGEIYKYAYTDGAPQSFSFLPGFYTKYGDVTPLLSSTDDQFVIYGPGDELVMRFALPQEPVPGTHREFLTFSDGYYKGDKSATTQTVDPLPFAAMTNYPYGASEHYPDDAVHQDYQAKWNTRSSEDATSQQVTLLSVVGDAVQGVVSALQATLASVSDALGLGFLPTTGAAEVLPAPEPLHRSLNTDFVGLSVSTPGGSSGATGCVVCHGLHGGAPSWDGSTPAGALLAPSGRLCTGTGSGGCHASAANSVSGVNIAAGLTASANDSAHHDLTEDAQRRTGARTACGDCHDPHTETRAARYSEPGTASASITTSLGPYVDASGNVYALVASKHDATPPTISGLGITGGGVSATVLTPTVTWNTNEPATTWIDWGTSSGSYTSHAGTDALTMTHSLNMTGLVINTTYYWRVRSVDPLGNASSSAEGMYSTNLAPPTITSGPTLTGYGWSDWATPTVTWRTSDAVTTVLEWGTAPGVYTSSTVTPGYSIDHTAQMTKLAAGTTYYWRVRGVDSIGRVVTSAEASYAANPPSVPIITMGPFAVGTTWSTYATPTVIWNTSDLSSSWVEWGTSSGTYTQSAGSSTATTTHAVQISTPSTSTVYYYHVFGFDPYGRIVSSPEATYQPAVPAVPTMVSGPSAAATSYATQDQPLVTWTTSDLTSSKVEWGTSPGSYTASATDSAQATSHGVRMSSLVYGTTYYYRVSGLDPLGRPITASAEATYAIVPYPTPAAVTGPDSVAYDSGFGQYSADVTYTRTLDSTLPNGHALEYRLYVNGAPAGAGWSTATTWTVTLTGTPAGVVYNVTVVARDQTNPSLMTASAVKQTTVVDYATYTGSCPFIYTWDGSGFAFGADLNTTGKLGEKTSTGYSAPGPTDRYILPSVPAVKDGAYELRLVEERREVDYTDQFKLYAIDLPDGIGIAAEKGERARSGPIPPGGLHTLQGTRAPLTMRTDTGEDVTSLISTQDGSSVQLNTDRENFGYKTLELDLGDVSSAPQVKIVMFARTDRPMTPAGTALQRTFGATTKLEVQSTSGSWRSVPASEATLPNAMEFPRTYVFDITKAMHDTTGKIRMTYLFKTTIDRIGVDTSADQAIQLTEVPMRSASLGWHGIDRHDQPGEDYDYLYTPDSTTSVDFIPGNYTRYGDIKDLLTTIDDKFAIYGPGDELTMRFDPLPAPAEGTHREFLTFSDSYYKGAKSAVTQTVDPLPFAAMTNYPYGVDEHYPDDADHLQYIEQYNTRSSADPTSTTQPVAVAPLSLSAAKTTVAFGGRSLGSQIAALGTARTADASKDGVGPWLSRHGAAALGSSAWVATAKEPVYASHYSANTNAASLVVSRFDDGVATVMAGAGWASTGATPTPSAPGTAVAGSEMAKAASVDATYWVTDLAVAEGATNYQLMRFAVPSSPATAGIRDFHVEWTGHGEPTANHPTSFYLWNNATGSWELASSGQWGTDVAAGKLSERSASTFCLRCHSAAPPAGVTMPAGMVNLATTWTSTGTAGDYHGDRGGAGFGSGLAPGLARGSKAFACMTCHDPHGNGNVYHLETSIYGKTGIAASTSPESARACTACHTGTPNDWHAYCNNCHFAPDAHESAPWIGDSLPAGWEGWGIPVANDCLACHRHGGQWTHPPSCHCGPYPSSFKTF